MSTFLVAGLAAVAGGLLAARQRRNAAEPAAQARRLGRKGLPIAAIARRTGLSQDAVRAVLGQVTGGTRRTGSFFRSAPGDQPWRALTL